MRDNCSVEIIHISKALIKNGDAARMGPHAFAAYCVIKCHANLATGHSFPSIEHISELAGVSGKQIKRSIIKLANMGYLVKTRSGRNNGYQLKERVLIVDKTENPRARATWNYTTNSFEQEIANLKEALAISDLSDTGNIRIERLTQEDLDLERDADNNSLSEDIKERLFTSQTGLCTVCDLPLTSNSEIDHVMPLSLGGSNTDDNVQLLHGLCNRRKSGKHPEDFMKSKKAQKP